jgi:hypothetical protein
VEEAFAVLLEIMRDSTAVHATRLRAAQTVIERAWGRVGPAAKAAAVGAAAAAAATTHTVGSFVDAPALTRRNGLRTSVVWAPQAGPQPVALTARHIPELLYGGAAGGGKSDFLLGDWLQDVARFGAAWQGVLFRRSYPELEELLKRSRELYPATDAAWNEDKRTWTWPSGASLKLRYLGAERDATRYQGHQYSWIGWDELTQWPTLGAYRLLRARLRSAHEIP